MACLAFFLVDAVCMCLSLIAIKSQPRPASLRNTDDPLNSHVQALQIQAIIPLARFNHDSETVPEAKQSSPTDPDLESLSSQTSMPTPPLIPPHSNPIFPPRRSTRITNARHLRLWRPHIDGLSAKEERIAAVNPEESACGAAGGADLGDA